MIEYRTGDLFDSGADCLINTVNCEGYMGKGVAYQFKLRFPENNNQYVKECRSGKLRPGTLFVFKEDGKTIVNFPTKDKWREDSKEAYIIEGLQALVKALPGLNVKTIAMPPLGCGNGGLQWNRVKDIINSAIVALHDQFHFIIYEPAKIINKVVIKKPPALSASALILIEMKRRLKKFNKIRLQKNAYFTNYFAGDHYFKFVKGEYGPYSHDIEIVANKIAEYREFYNINVKDTAALYQSVYATICSKKTDEKVEKYSLPVSKAVDFVNSIESDHELEGVATTMFLLEEQACNADEVWDGFVTWPGDKAARFTKDEIPYFIEKLEVGGFISCDLMNRYSVRNS